MKNIFSVFVVLIISAMMPLTSFGDRCQEAQYREQRRTLDQQIEDLEIQREFEENTARRDQISLRILQLETDRTNLVRTNMACWSRQ